MMFLKGGGLASILLVVFLGWVFIADGGMARIERICKPVQWVGTVAESATDLTIPQYSRKVDGWVDSLEFSCQYTVWRLFYEKEWQESQEQKQEESERLEEERKDSSGKKFHD